MQLELNVQFRNGTTVLGVDGMKLQDPSWHSVGIVVLMVVVVQSFPDSQMIRDSQFHFSTMHFGVEYCNQHRVCAADRRTRTALKY